MFFRGKGETGKVAFLGRGCGGRVVGGEDLGHLGGMPLHERKRSISYLVGAVCAEIHSDGSPDCYLCVEE